MFRRKIGQYFEKWKSEPVRKSLMISGARQVGKTTSVREFGKKYGRFVEINFELHPGLRRIFSGDLDTDTLVSRMRDEFGEDALIPGETLIFLDEIQNCPEARTSLKSFTEDPDWDVIASGSLLGVNYRQVSSYPVGYETNVTMHPLDFEEFLWATGVTDATISAVKNDIRAKDELDPYELELMNKKIREYMVVGGLPEVVASLTTTGSYGKVFETQTMLREQYRNDAGKYADVADRNRIFECFRSAADQLAKEADRFNYSDIKVDGQVGSGKVGRREYRSSIDWLIDAGVCLECRRVSDLMPPIIGKENLFRLYICDPGILVSMLPGSVRSLLDSEYSSNKGPLGENLVATCLHRYGIRPFYYKKKTTEVDFVTDFDGIMTAIEVKTGKDLRSKSLDSVMRDGRIERGIKLGTENICVDGKGVECYPLFAAGFPDCLFIPRPLPEFRMGEPGRFGPTP